MANLPLKLAGYPWDYLTPLRTGDVVPEGIDLHYDVHRGLGPVSDDPAYAGGEASLGRFMIDVSRGDLDFVGLPIFPMFAFRHRCFLVKRGTAIDSLSGLEGKRVGLDGWPNSGNTWTRITLSQAGVDIWKITWVIAPIEGSADASHGHVPPDAPPNVQGAAAGKSLVDLLLSGDIDVVVAAFMPTGFFSPGSPIVPMIPDYRTDEMAYYQKHGYIPAHHLVKLRREVVEREPWIVNSLMNAFTASKRLWLQQRRHLADTTPWLLADLMQTAAVYGDDWQPYGLEPNLKMLTDFCQGQYAQKLVSKPVDPVAAFADYRRFAGDARPIHTAAS
jgi:4,5-dihydroxyphthalate decarboxylase